VLATACGGHNALQVRAVRFLVIIVVVSRDRNPLRAPFSHLLATLGALLGISDGGVGWCRFAATGDRFPPTWDRDRVNSILAGGILGGDAEQGGIPENIIRCLEGWSLLRVMHDAPRHHWSWSLRTTAVSLPVVVSTPAWVTHATFMLFTHVPLASLAAHLGWHTLGSLP
jgi:hypothetical protein